MRRRGLFEVQFNWIFILIAGAVILGFFFSIVQKQQSISEQKRAISLLNELDAITTGASIARGAAQRLDLPKAGIDFACSDECLCEFRIGTFAKNYEDKLIFAPKHIEGKDVVFWTLDWKMPFRVANFLYATNDRIKYFFVYDESAGSQQLRAKIEDAVPEQVNAEYVTVDDVNCAGNDDCVRNENYVQVKFVFLDINPNLGALEFHESFQDTDLTATHITPDYVTFYQRIGTKTNAFTPTRTYYAGDAALYGSVFAYDEKMYRCNIETAARRLGYVTQVFTKRATELNKLEYGLVDRGCVYADQLFTPLMTNAAGQGGELSTEFHALTALAQTVESTNEQFLRDGCPPIY